MGGLDADHRGLRRRLPGDGAGPPAGGLTALASLGLVALPAGILAGAFTEAFRESRKGREI